MSVVGRNGEKVLLRFPEGMRERMKTLATENRRSMNTEIVTILHREIEQRLETEKAAELRA